MLRATSGGLFWRYVARFFSFVDLVLRAVRLQSASKASVAAEEDIVNQWSRQTNVQSGRVLKVSVRMLVALFFDLLTNPAGVGSKCCGASPYFLVAGSRKADSADTIESRG